MSDELRGRCSMRGTSAQPCGASKTMFLAHRWHDSVFEGDRSGLAYGLSVFWLRRYRFAIVHVVAIAEHIGFEYITAPFVNVRPGLHAAGGASPAFVVGNAARFL